MTQADYTAVDRKLALLRRRVITLVWWSGLCLTLTVVLGGVLAAGVLDRWFDDTGLRWLLAISVWTGLAFATYRFLLVPLRTSLTDVFLATQIERRYPGLSGRLSSAMAFRTTGCQPRMGSPVLQQLVVGQAWSDLRSVDPREIVLPQRIRPAIVSALSLALVAGVVLWAFPLHAGTALKRLAFPWTNTPWPRAVALKIVNREGTALPLSHGAELRAVRGSVQDFTVENARGKLPDEIWLETRTNANTPPVRELLRRVTQEGAGKPKTVAAITLPVTRDSLEFRAVGGDDDLMPWHRLELVEPPTLSEFSLAIQPPAYLQLPEETLPRGSVHVTGWVGSVVRFSGTASKPLAKVELRRRDGVATPVTLDANHTDFHASLTIEQPGAVALWFQLIDDEGFTEPEPLQFEIRGQADAVPEVTLREPTTDLFVTPDAEIGLIAEIADDWGLSQARLTWQRDGFPVMQRLLTEWDDRRRQASLETTWPLSDLTLAPGERVMYRVEADDICNLSGAHTGRSAPRMLTVVSKEEKRQDLAARIGELVEDLQQAQEQQARLRQQTADLVQQLNNVGTLRPEDKDSLQRLELDQRQLTQQLTDSSRGMAARARQLRQDFPINKLSDPETEANLEELVSGLEKLEESAFSRLARELTQASKMAEAKSPTTAESSPPPPETGAALNRAADIQDDLLQSLEDWQRQFSEWKNERALTQHLESLLKEQTDLNRQTGELGSQTVGKSTAELTPQQRADLQKLSLRQRQQSQRLDQFERQLRDQSEAVEDEQPQTAAQLLEAADQIHDAQITSRLRQAADDLAANRLSDAGAAQQAAENLLKKTQSEWNAVAPDDTEQLVKQIDQAQDVAEQIASDEEHLQKQAEEAQADGMSPAERTALREEATRLRKQLQKLERQLQHLRLKPAAEAAQRAADRLRTAEQQLEEGGAAEEAMESIAEAGADIEQLQDELAAAEHAAVEQLAEEEFQKLTGKLAGLRERQESVLAETVRLEDERKARGQWTRGQLRSLKELADVQKSLHSDLTELQSTLAQATVVKKALEFAERDLRRAAARLDARQTDVLTQDCERQVIKRLTQLLEAWDKKPATSNEAPAEEPKPQDAPEPQTAGPPGESLPPRLELQLLRDMQADCLERTKAWELRRVEQGRLSDEELTQVQELAGEQGELGALAEQLIAQFVKSPPASNPPMKTPETVP